MIMLILIIIVSIINLSILGEVSGTTNQKIVGADEIIDKIARGDIVDYDQVTVIGDINNFNINEKSDQNRINLSILKDIDSKINITNSTILGLITLTPHHVGNMFNPSLASISLIFFGISITFPLSPKLM